MAKQATPWERAKDASRWKKGTEHERGFAEKTGAKPQVNSGRHWFSKRDNVYAEFLVENRVTDSGSYSIKRDEFIQIGQEGKQTPPGLLPAIQPTIQGLDLWVMHLSDFMALNEELISLRAIVNGIEEEEES